MGSPSAHTLTITMPRRDAGTVQVHIGGDLDLSTSERLRDALRSARGSDGSAKLCLDLSRVTFLDCASIGVLVSLNRDAGVAIIAASPVVDRLMTLLELGVAFDYPTAAPSLPLVP